MNVPKIEERTLYPPIINHLQNIGFKAIGETKVAKKHPDILFQIDSISFVIEVKIGEADIGLKAVAQASDYAKKLNTHNIIILIYSEKYRNELITDSSVVEKIALKTNVNALVLTEYWTENLTIEPIKLFEQLKKQILLKEIKIDFNTIVNLIGSYVRDYNSIIYQVVTDELIIEVVNKLDLFSSISDIKDKETAKKQIINLASYLLFNQLLFYHIYNKKAITKNLPELEEIKEVKNIQKYFNKITEINYQSIYKVNILGHIPNIKIVIDTLNELIKGIKLLRAEHITHDLAGRFFHDLIPFEVRKVLAAFYTSPIAADLLTGLTIDSWDETVIDPACGSGTLLVSSYKRKQELYQKLYGYKDSKEMHKKFIQDDLTGIDIMPFAAHISAINLTMQNIEEETNIVRIATLDSLEMVDSLKSLKFKRKGIEISPYTTSIQLTINGSFGKPIKIEKRGAIAPKGKGAKFFLKPVNVVIMNPPFSDREKMPSDMREKIKKNPLGDICGHSINLWGYFLALADIFLKTNGKMGAVIPVNIARGRATQNIRNYLLENYYLRYIIKSTKDLGFSEGSAFRDILLIAEKRKPKTNDFTCLIFFNRSIREFSLGEIEETITLIRDLSENHKDFKSKEIDICFLPLNEILELKDNLMPIIGLSKSEYIKIFSNFVKRLEQNINKKIMDLKNLPIKEGFHASPAGLSELVFITKSYTKDRISRAFLIYDDDIDPYQLNVRIRNIDLIFKIKKEYLIPALRTLTSIDKFNVENMDFFIKSKPKDFDRILLMSKWKDKENFNWKIVETKMKEKEHYLAVARRFNPHSPNTHFFAFYHPNKFICPDTFKIIKIDKDTSKYQCLFLNSVFTLLNIINFREQTTGEYTDIRQTELDLFKVFNVNNLTESDKQTLNSLFDELKDLRFPSIIEQLETRFKGRVELDKAILKILGFTMKEINEWLPKIYDAIVDELKAMKSDT